MPRILILNLFILLFTTSAFATVQVKTIQGVPASVCQPSDSNTNCGGSSGSSLWVQGNVGINTTNNVGIGSTSPGDLLDIGGASAGAGTIGLYDSANDEEDKITTNDAYITSDTPFWIKDKWLSPNPSLQIDAQSGGQTVAYFSIGSSGSGASDVFIVNKDGNVGIGTSNPTKLLSIGAGPAAYVDSSGAGKFSSVTTSTTNTNYFDGLVDSGGGMRVRGGNDFLDFGSLNNESIQDDSDTSGNLGIFTNSTQRLTVMNNGNVGIGTISPGGVLEIEGGNVGIGVHSPSYKLYVNGGIASAYNVLDDGGGNTTLSRELIVNNSNEATTSLQIYDTAGNTSFKINGSDTAGVGNYVQTKNNILDGNGQIRSKSGISVGSSYLSTTIPSNGEIIQGNVGIGSANPVTILDVNGTTRTTGFQLTTNPSSGYVLTSNNVGIGTWAPASGGGSMTYPSGSGIAVVSSGTSWGTTLTAPSGTIVGTTDTQTLTNKTLTSPTLTTPNLGTPSAIVLTNATGTAANVSVGTANALNSATTIVNVSSATAPSSGQVLTATGPTAATWQTPSSGSSQWATQNTTDVSLAGGNVGIGTTYTTTAALTVMNGNVGIGTWNPGTDLFQIKNHNDFSVSSSGSMIANGASLLGSLTMNANPIKLTSGTITTTSGNIGIGTTNVTGAGLSVMTGNVGIGTWEPDTSLSVAGNVDIGTFGGGTKVLTFNSGTPAKVTWRPDDGGTGNNTLNVTLDGQSIFNYPSEHDGFLINAASSSSNMLRAAMGAWLTGTGTQGSGYLGGFFGGYHDVGSSAPSIGTAYGAEAYNYLEGTNTRTFSNLFGFLSYGDYEGSGLTVTNYYGLQDWIGGIGTFTGTNAYGIDIESGPTNYSNLYGIYIDTLSPGSGNSGWGIYDHSGEPDYFGGNVGIGTANPGADLDIRTTISPVIRYIYPIGNHTRFELDSSGNVSIGTSLPTGTLTVQGSGSTSSTQSLGIENSSGTALFNVNNAGNVGIGSTAPSQLLDVAGTAAVDNIQFNGSTLGYMNWSPSTSVLNELTNGASYFDYPSIGTATAFTSALTVNDLENTADATRDAIAGWVTTNNSSGTDVYLQGIAGGYHDSGSSGPATIFGVVGTTGFNLFQGSWTRTITNAYGQFGANELDAASSNLTITNDYGGYFDTNQCYTNCATGETITNSYGLYVDNPTNPGTMTNNYGLYIAGQTGGSTNYSIYTDGTSPSYFGGTTTTNACSSHSGQVSCWATGGKAGYCTSVVGATGACTCSAC